MDDVVAELLEQIAFSGSIGVHTADLWPFVDAHFKKRQEEQTIDSAYQSHLWSLLVSCPDVVISISPTGANKLVPLVDATTVPLDDLLAQHGDALALCTTERQQWMTLTGHGVDHKEVR